jgi:hypothetical protein
MTFNPFSCEFWKRKPSTRLSIRLPEEYTPELARLYDIYVEHDTISANLNVWKYIKSIEPRTSEGYWRITIGRLCFTVHNFKE